jgi:anti-sigma B factor antagonist
MRISERQVGNVVVLDLVGPLAGPEAARIVEEAVLRHARAGTHTVVANLADVQSIDLGGLDALVDAYPAMREAGGEIRIASLARRIHDSAVIARLLSVFDSFDSVEQAIGGPIPPCPGVILSPA